MKYSTLPKIYAVFLMDLSSFDQDNWNVLINSMIIIMLLWLNAIHVIIES